MTTADQSPRQSAAFPLAPERVRAVVLDFGGVLMDGGPRMLRAFGGRIGLAQERWDALMRELFLESDWWDRVERAELSLDLFVTELRRRLAEHGVHLSQQEAHTFMGDPDNPTHARMRHEVVDAARRLHERIPTALLTNNVAEWRPIWRGWLDVDALFDVVVDSSEVGTRKPEPAIYAETERRLGLSGEALLFVDDLGVNLKPARQRGWQTLKYVDTAEVLDVLHRVADQHPPRQ